MNFLVRVYGKETSSGVKINRREFDENGNFIVVEIDDGKSQGVVVLFIEQSFAI